MISLILSVALVAAGDSAADGTAKAPKVNKDGMICKKEHVVGSRMPQRVCMPPEQWEARRAEDRDNLDQAQRQKPLQSN